MTKPVQRAEVFRESSLALYSLRYTTKLMTWSAILSRENIETF